MDVSLGMRLDGYPGPLWHHAVMTVPNGVMLPELANLHMILCSGTRQTTGSWSSTMYDTCIHSTISDEVCMCVGGEGGGGGDLG